MGQDSSAGSRMETSDGRREQAAGMGAQMGVGDTRKGEERWLTTVPSVLGAV